MARCIDVRGARTAKLYMLSKKKRTPLQSHGFYHMTASSEPATFSMAEAFKKARR